MAYLRGGGGGDGLREDLRSITYITAKIVHLCDFSVNPIHHIDPLPRPHRDVFIWAVLSNRIAMAKLMWIMGREQIPCALMATRLLKSMASKSASDDTITDISVELLANAE